MGVTGLWQILQPCARPIKIETLNRKRLAVDASIWIYQFLKAVRDKEGNALRNSHVVGFFRRICKLLFFGIKPVFVFDGGAPALKRATINARKRRREGRRDDAVRTAGKLLAVQMQRRAEEEELKRREEHDRGTVGQEEEPVPDEELVYVDELQMSAQERQQNRKFRKKDAYHLPDLDVSISEMGGPNDPRVMSLEELEAYARHFDSGEDINVYDFSKIDYDSPFFMSLPASDRYNILNAARLRSRLRMGHSKEQLDSMFPDRMAFSRFQIERVKERNELTTRLMNINDGDIRYQNGSTRVAGEKAREYVLVKNDGVEGGWALGVISDEGTRRETAIDVDKPAATIETEASDSEDTEFEDVAIEGLNRLPKRRKLDHDTGDDGFAQNRHTLDNPRRSAAQGRRPMQAADSDSLFVAGEIAEEDDWEEVDAKGDLFGEALQPGEEDEELRQAIALSLQQDSDDSNAKAGTQEISDAPAEDWYQSFRQRAAEEARPVPKGSARAIASILNKRAHGSAPESHETTSFGVPVPKQDSTDAMSENSDEDVDLQAALAESRRTKRKPTPLLPQQGLPWTAANGATSSPGKKSLFSGPLPFESINLGNSLLGKKKMQKHTEEAEGGFEKDKAAEAEKEARKREPLPPWFTGDLDEGMKRQQELEREDRERAREFAAQFSFQGKGEGLMRRRETIEVVDLEADGDTDKAEVIDLERDEETGAAGTRKHDTAAEGPTGKPVDGDQRMGDLADALRTQPPVGILIESQRDTSARPSPVAGLSTAPGPFLEEEDDKMDESSTALPDDMTAPVRESGDVGKDELIDWSESEDERKQTVDEGALDIKPAGGERVPASQPFQSSPLDPGDVSDALVQAQSAQARQSKSASPEFEDVDMSVKPRPPPSVPANENRDILESLAAPASGLAAQSSMLDDDEDAFDEFDDSEEEAMLQALAQEAEEHARFASTLNNKSTAENIAEYEKELKQLRNQQKKDRRDADEVTHIMITECQQLLRFFGLPYVTAPMEAEAQCAELVRLGLVDGIVTDDSDCFLFGGTRIYKNMFNQAKFVECYLASDLEKEFDLTRQKLINIAHLLGSDYTEGLPGVGPVTALEILSEFPDLRDFKEWWSGVQMNTIPKDLDAGNPFRKKFRKNATKLFLPPAFPDPRVDVAYREPDVDSDPQPFQWGVPDLDALRSFLMATIGWSPERTDEVLVPVIRDMNRRADEGTQANITAFFEGGVGVGAAGTRIAGEAFAPRKRVDGSKRMGKALGKMAERAKVQRKLDQSEVGKGDDDHERRVDMSAIEVPVEVGREDSDEIRQTNDQRKKSSGPRRRQQSAEDADVGVAEKRPKKSTRRKGAMKRTAATAADDDADE